MEKSYKKNITTDKISFIKNVSTITIFRGFGVFSGVFLDAIILAKFGLSKEMDALFAALSIPMILTKVFEYQAPNVLVPVFTDIYTNHDSNKVAHLIGNLVCTSFLALLCCSFFGMFLADLLIPIQVPGFDPDLIQLAINLNKVLFWLIIIRGMEIIFASIILSYHKFLAPSSGRLITNLIAIGTVLLFYPKFGIFSVAIGHILGGITSLLIMSYIAFYIGARFKFVCKLNDPNLLNSAKLFIHPISGHVISESKELIENYLISFLTRGHLSALRYAIRIVSAITGVLVGGVATATLPVVSHFAANKKIEEMKESLLQGIKATLLIALPISVWLIFSSKSILILMFERGEFTRADVSLTGTLISLMVPYVIFSRMISIFQTPFYATLDTKPTMYSMIVSFGIYGLTVFSIFKILNVFSFPIAHSISSICAASFMFIIFRNKFGGFSMNEVGIFLFKLIISIIIMTISLSVFEFFQTNFEIVTFIDKLIICVIPTLLGFGIFGFTSLCIKLVDYRKILKR